MMEFTYDGMVRYGFGFYNPNHAAALICAVMPFLWGWKRFQPLGWCLSLILTVPLAMTYSRTGMAVLILELAAFFLLSKYRNWKLIGAILGSVAAIAAAGGVLARFTLDRAILNRPEIWLAGIKLYSANPMGVGAGNSGMLASTFLLENIQCRTLVNSHLTLLAEFGIPAGFLWGFAVLYALIRGTGRIRCWCAFAGLTLSASMASVFDWGVLFDFRDLGGLPLSNFLLSWLTLLLYLALGVTLAWRKTSWKFPAAAAGITAACLLIPLLFATGSSPAIRDGLLVRVGDEIPLVIYDESWTLKTVLPFLKDGYRIPLRPGIHRTAAENVWLFGNAAEYAGEYPGARLILVSPPEFAPISDRTVKIYRRPFEPGDENPGCEVIFY